MKRNMLQMVLATLMAVCTGTAVNAEDWAPGEGMEATMAVNIALGKTIEGKSDYGFCDTCY
ncbi:MAG: hypothetical protein RLZZ436_2994, partial [Planctomycetota bacterium]